MKWVLIVVGAIIGLFALMALIGAFVARDHVASSTIDIRQPSDTVWATMRDLASLSSWWPSMIESRQVQDSAGREVWEQKMKGGWVIRGIITESVPPRRFVSTIDAASGASFGGSWTYDVEPVAGGSRVTVTERGWIANPMFRFMSRFIMGYHGSLDSYLTALARRFGETARPTHR